MTEGPSGTHERRDDTGKRVANLVCAGLAFRRSAHREAETPLAGVDPDRVAVLDLTGKEPQRERVLDLPLDQPLQRPRAERGVVTLVRDVLPRGIGQIERELPVGNTLLELSQLDVHDLRDLR